MADEGDSRWPRRRPAIILRFMSRRRRITLGIALGAGLALPVAPQPPPQPAEMRPDAVIVKLRGQELHGGSKALDGRLADLPESERSPVFPQLRGSKSLAPDLAGLARIERISFRQPVDVVALCGELADLPEVEYAEPVYRLRATAAGPNDPLLGSSGAWGQSYRDLWGLQTIGAAAAWSRATGAGVRLAIVDTGSDLEHPDLAANLWRNSREVPGNRRDDDGNGWIDDVFGWDFANDDADPSDDNGHGTHVAGTAAAVGDNRIGIAGVAWRAQVMSVKALDRNGTGDSDRIARGISYAMLNGARVINMSLGASAVSRVLEDALAAAHARGVVLVAAAGNDNADATTFHPASSRLAITVGAANRQDRRSPFSNFGAVLDLLAPGGDGGDLAGANVLSLRSRVLSNQYLAQLRVGDRYLRLAGTSMAAPHVAGAAALLLQVQPGLSPEEVRQVLRRTSRDVAAPGWERDSGYGRLNAAAAVAGTRQRGAARFLRPLAGSVVTAATTVLAGTATAAGFVRYDVEIGAGPAPTSWKLLARSSSPTPSGRLALLDANPLDDGPYLLRLTVVGRSGARFEDRLAISVDRVRITSPVKGDKLRGGDVVAVTGTAAAGGFRSFEVQFREPGSPAWSARGVTLAGDGRAPVGNGPLASWDTTGLPRGYYRLRLVVHRDGGADQTEEVPDLLIDSAFHPGWPRRVSDSTLPGLVVDQNATAADLDGDGRSELLVAQGEQVRVFQDDGTQAPGWPQGLPTPSFVTRTQRSPAAADLDGDGTLEVIVPTNSSHLFVFGADGTLRTPNPPLVAHDAAVADAAGDSRPEIATTSSFLGGAWLLDAALLPLPGWPKRFPAAISQLSPPVLADLDGDGKVEVIFTEGSGALVLYAYHGDGTPVAGFPRTLAPDAAAGTHGFQPVAGDVDGDGRLEVVTGTSEGRIFVVGADGRDLPGWPVTLPEAQYYAGPASLGDLLGDGAAEIVIGAATRTGGNTAVLYALDGPGQVLPGWPVRWGPGGAGAVVFFYGFGTAAIADVDGDGARDVVVDRGDAPRTGAFALDAYSATGQELPGFPFLTGTGGPSPNSTPAILDFDGDGFLEVAWISNDGVIFVWDLDAPAAGGDLSRGWPMFRHDPAHTGTLPATEPVSTAASQ
jgi:subtilisin family serine protease